jgi:hypothetical protein
MRASHGDHQFPSSHPFGALRGSSSSRLAGKGNHPPQSALSSPRTGLPCPVLPCSVCPDRPGGRSSTVKARGSTTTPNHPASTDHDRTPDCPPNLPSSQARLLNFSRTSSQVGKLAKLEEARRRQTQRIARWKRPPGERPDPSMETLVLRTDESGVGSRTGCTHRRCGMSEPRATCRTGWQTDRQQTTDCLQPAECLPTCLSSLPSAALAVPSSPSMSCSVGSLGAQG